MDWLTEWKLPIGSTAKIVFDWLKTQADAAFKLLGDGIESAIEGLTDILASPPLHILLWVAASSRWLTCGATATWHWSRVLDCWRSSPWR